MIPYILLLFIPFLFYFVCLGGGNRKMKQLRLGLGVDNEKENISLPVFFIFLFLMLSCRSISVGRDLHNYNYIWNRDASSSLLKIIQEWNEPLFKIYNYLTHSISDNFQWYLTITAAITLLPLAYTYCKDKSHPFVKIAIFVNMSTFVMLFSGIRQSIAISLGVVCFELIKRKKNIWFVIVAIIASLIHASGFMIFALFPLYYIRFKRKHLLFVVPAIGVLFAFNRYVFIFLATIFRDDTVEISSTGAIGSLALFIVFSVVSYILSDESKMDEESYALRNILLFAVCLQSFASLHALAMRMNYYFIIFIPLAMAKCFSDADNKYKNVAKIIEIVICVFFAVDYCYGTINSYISGVSALDTIPYIPFWAE